MNLSPHNQAYQKPISATLIIVGHGSTTNSDSSEPTHLHADEIRSRGIFNEVRCCFWKEEPSLREILYGITSDTIYVVPNFISEGYFTQKVIPRELGLDEKVTLRDGKKIVPVHQPGENGNSTFCRIFSSAKGQCSTEGASHSDERVQKIYYCEPVGNHPLMTEVILKRAKEVAPNVAPEKTSLLIVGHGTNLNENSAQAAKEQVAIIRAMNLYAEVLPTYMEEPPLISDWNQLAREEHVVVVPFFISDGLHSYQDIPVLLGIEQEVGLEASRREVFRNNPHELHGKKLYYASAIGTEPMMADVILDQVMREVEGLKG